MYNLVIIMADCLPRIRDALAYLLLTLALTVFAVAPLAYPGYVQAHSGFIPVYNLASLAQAGIETGWVPSIPSSYDPVRGDGLLPYYLAWPVVWMGATPLNAVKAVLALGFLGGAAGVFVWLRGPLGPAGAALAALVYTYLPYRLATVYVRGGWGEAFFLALLPWGLAVAEDHAAPGRRGWIALTTTVWALLGLCQPGLAVWAFLLLAAWQLLIRRTRTNYAALFAALGGMAAALALGLLISGFSIPDSPINFFDHFLYPAQIFSAYWGFGASRPGWEDGLALGLGFAALGLAMLTTFLATGRARTDADHLPSAANRLPDLRWLSLVTLVPILLMLSPAALLWQLTGLHYTLSYPWQLLSLAGLCLSALAGAAVRIDQRLARLPAYAALVVLTLLSSYSYLQPRFTELEPGTRPLAAWDGYGLMLLDYDLSVDVPPVAAGLSEPTSGRLSLADYGMLGPGDTLHVSLTWQATRPFDRDLKLFLHLLDASGQVVTQVDPLAGAEAGPAGTEYLTSHWDPGELILDDVPLIIPLGVSPGAYRLALGLYDGDTLERLPVVGREDGQVEFELEIGDRDGSKETASERSYLRLSQPATEHQQ